MRPPADLYNAPLVLRSGHARAMAVRGLIRSGHKLDPSLRGRSKVVALYTSPDGTRGALLRRMPKTGRVIATRFGALTAREIRFLHALASSVA